MERHCLNAKTSLKFLVDSIPEDDPKLKTQRDSFKASLTACDEIIAVLAKEEHDAFSKIKKPGESCMCKTCKAEQFFEVIHSLSKEELLEIIASEMATELGRDASCVKAVKESTKEESKEETKAETKADIIIHC